MDSLPPPIAENRDPNYRTVLSRQEYAFYCGVLQSPNGIPSELDSSNRFSSAEGETAISVGTNRRFIPGGAATVKMTQTILCGETAL
jgi:hypothetical protein